jgi:hypothetical protein
MNIQEYTHLQAERKTLRRMLEEIPAENVLERSGLALRLEVIEQELAAAGTPRRGPARAILTFRGRPVIDQHGIFADFGGKATTLFTDAVAKVGAGLAGRLSAAGAVSNRDESQLLITSTALGSFGFELEEYRPGMLDFGEESPVGRALELTRGLLESTLGTDDDLADCAASVEPRAVAAVRDFLDLLASNEAVCTLEYGERLVRFRDVGEVRRAVQRLSQDNLREEETTLSGEFQGILPEGRRFEFRRVEGGEVVRGKIGSAIGDPGVLNRHLHQTVQITVLETRVGNGKPRYTLLALPTWPSER